MNPPAPTSPPEPFPVTDPAACPFCRALHLLEARPGTHRTVAYLADGFPLTDGHTLVVPRDHHADLLTLPSEVAAALWETALDLARHLRATDPTVVGVNVGVNVGAVAGQTVGHVHLHVVPRRVGDTADPRGGVRWVVPERAAYWPAPPAGPVAPTA